MKNQILFVKMVKMIWYMWFKWLKLLFSNIRTGPMNSSDAGGNGGGELFEKFQRQKFNRESSVNSGVSTDT